MVRSSLLSRVGQAAFKTTRQRRRFSRRVLTLLAAPAVAACMRGRLPGSGEATSLGPTAVPGIHPLAGGRNGINTGFLAAAGAMGVATAAAASEGGRGESSVGSTSEAGSSLTTSVLNLSKNIIGAGMLSLPFAMKGAGVVPFLLGITLCGALNAYTFFLLGWSCHAVGASSFGELWSKTFGPKNAWIADAAVLANNSLACLAYCVLIGDFLSKSLTGLLPDTLWLHGRGTDLILVAVLFLAPLSLLKDLAPLRYASIAGLVATLYVFLMLAHDCYTEADFTSLDSPVRRNFMPLRIDFFQALALFSSAFMAHYNSPKFYAQLQDRTMPRFASLVAGAFGLSLVVFIVFGFCGFALFGFATEGNVLKNYGFGNEVMLAWMSMAFSVVFTYPLVFSTFRDSCGTLLSRLGFISDPSSSSFRVPFTLGAVALTVLGGTVFSNVAIVNGVKGAILSSLLAFIFPACIHLQLSKAQSSKQSKLMRSLSMFLIAFGVFAGILALLAMFVIPKTDFSEFTK